MSETLGILLIEGRGGLARALLSSRAELHVTHADRMAKAIALSAPARAAGGISALLVDLSLPDCRGLEAYRRAATLLPGTPIVALLRERDDELMAAALREGAQACLEYDGLDGSALSLALRQAVLRKEAEARRFRALWDAAPVGLLLAAGRRVLMANPAALETLGYDEAGLASLSVPDLFPAAARPILEGALDAAPGEVPESRFTADMARKDGSSLRCRVHVTGANCNDAPAVALWLEPVLAGEAPAPSAGDPVRQTRKMEALGRLAGNVAHDFNNLLTTINGYSEHLLNLPGSEGPIASGLKAIQRAGDTAAALTRGLLSFSRAESEGAKPVLVDAAVREMVPMLRRMAGEGIELRVRTGAGRAAVDMDPGKLEQLILNLCANARDAMPGGGTLSLVTEAIDVGPEEGFTHLAAPAGPHVAITVEDTGIGMGPETLESLFEPYFTTKRGGRGTGLGLAAVYAIAGQAGGGISVTSVPGSGSRFRIALGRSKAEARTEAAAESPAAAQASGGEGGTVLVVEDEPSLREMILTILGRYGFDLLEASSADEASDIVAASPAGVDLVVTDVMLRGDEGGHEMAARLQALKPGLRTLFISGHSHDSLAERGVHVPADAFLEKPFSPSQLAARVRLLMQAARNAG